MTPIHKNINVTSYADCPLCPTGLCLISSKFCPVMNPEDKGRLTTPENCPLKTNNVVATITMKESQ